MTWVIVLISLTTGLVVAEIPYGNAPDSNDLVAVRRAEVGCMKISAVRAEEFNREHPDRQVKPGCRTQ